MTVPDQQEIPVYLVDSSIYIFQSHFSPYVEYYDRSGEDLSAVFGFTQFLLQFLRRVKPKHLVLAHDESLFCGFRHDLCPNYKSNRELPDDNLAKQLQACFEIGPILGLTSFSSTVYEADDIIGTVSTSLRQSAEEEMAMHIVSRDKDLAQLLKSERDCLWDYSGNRRRYRDDIKQEYGVKPEQFPDYLGLVGDSVDCISGVPGVGPVKAKELLANFHSLDGIYDNLENIAELSFRGAKSVGELLSKHRDLANLSKRLATIICNVETDAESFSGAKLASSSRKDVNMELLGEFLETYQFGDSEAQRILAMASSMQNSRSSQ